MIIFPIYEQEKAENAKVCELIKEKGIDFYALRNCPTYYEYNTMKYIECGRFSAKDYILVRKVVLGK